MMEGNAIFKSILEQMLAGGNDLKARFEDSPTDSIDNSNNTYVHRLPLREGDTIVLYIRARAKMNASCRYSCRFSHSGRQYK